MAEQESVQTPQVGEVSNLQLEDELNDNEGHYKEGSDENERTREESPETKPEGNGECQSDFQDNTVAPETTEGGNGLEGEPTVIFTEKYTKIPAEKPVEGPTTVQNTSELESDGEPESTKGTPKLVPDKDADGAEQHGDGEGECSERVGKGKDGLDDVNEVEEPPENDREEPVKNDREEPTEDDREEPTEDDKEKPAEDDREEPAEDDREEPAEDDREKPAEDDTDEPALSREDVIAELMEQLSTHEQLRATNARLQHKIAEYLSKKKTEDRHDPSKSVTDHEQRYFKCMDALESLQTEDALMESKRKLEKAEIEERSKAHLSLVEAKKLEYIAFCKQKSLEAVHSRTGRTLTLHEFEQLVAEDALKEKDVIQARLENIRLQTIISKKEALVKQKEELGEGLHVIDFEQLKIDNVNLNEKIEERNEDLIKLRKKITGTVQVLTHVKEKLQFVQAENESKRFTLSELDVHLSRRRDHLTRFKQVRDALRIDNVKLRHQGGLVSHLDLLRDFEDQVDKNENKTMSVGDMQNHYGSTMMACNRIRKKIARVNMLPDTVQ